MVNPWPMMVGPILLNIPLLSNQIHLYHLIFFFIMVVTEIIVMEKDDGKPSNLDYFKKHEQQNSTTKHPQHFFYPTNFLAITKHVMSNNPPRVVTPLGGESGPPQGGSGPLGNKRPSRRSGPCGSKEEMTLHEDHGWDPLESMVPTMVLNTYHDYPKYPSY